LQHPPCWRDFLLRARRPRRSALLKDGARQRTEWSDKESFLEFFQSTPEIPQMFADAGVNVEPHPVFWEKVTPPPGPSRARPPGGARR
jgi:hypothetical protein